MPLLSLIICLVIVSHETKICLPFLPMLMSALLDAIIVMPMQPVLTQIEVLLALVRQDTVLLALVVKASII